MNKQRCHFVGIMKYKTVSPSDDRASKGTVGQTVTGGEEVGVRWKEPDVNKVELERSY